MHANPRHRKPVNKFDRKALPREVEEGKERLKHLLGKASMYKKPVDKEMAEHSDEKLKVLMRLPTSSAQLKAQIKNERIRRKIAAIKESDLPLAVLSKQVVEGQARVKKMRSGPLKKSYQNTLTQAEQALSELLWKRERLMGDLEWLQQEKD